LIAKAAQTNIAKTKQQYGAVRRSQEVISI
jgi:hypothetical protein